MDRGISHHQITQGLQQQQPRRRKAVMYEHLIDTSGLPTAMLNVLSRLLKPV
jgi:hypothetical protein